jgi:F0F1-type ATP synthase assembly protein I
MYWLKYKVYKINIPATEITTHRIILNYIDERKFMVSFIAGAFVGCIIGFAIAALCVAGHDDGVAR